MRREHGIVFMEVYMTSGVGKLSTPPARSRKFFRSTSGTAVSCQKYRNSNGCVAFVSGLDLAGGISNILSITSSRGVMDDW